MKATGIVRRIDDLGRVVIPKEIRRTLRIREGDPLEIFVARHGEVILKKYSPINELGQFAQEYAEALFDSLNLPVLICDRDEVIAVAGESKKDFMNKSIGEQITEAIGSRAPVIERSTMKIELIEGQEYEVGGYCLYPVIANGDPIGAVLLFAKDGQKLVNEAEKALETAAIFLGKQME